MWHLRGQELELIRRDPPDVLFVANASNGQRNHAAYIDSYARLLDRVPESTSVVVVEDAPRNIVDPLSCASRHLDDPLVCALAKEDAAPRHADSTDYAAAGKTGSGLLEVVPWICGDVCPLIQGDVLVYKDGDHLTATFARLLTPVFEQEINAFIERPR